MANPYDTAYADGFIAGDRRAVNSVEDEIARLHEQLAEARELLKPLKRQADAFERHMGDDMKLVDPNTHMVAMGIWVVDCQRARAFLDKADK